MEADRVGEGKAEAIAAATEAVLKQTKEISGLPVAVLAEANLSTMAVTRVARGGAPSHTILYKSSAASRPDYLICFQCGFMIREFTRPPERRRLFASSNNGRYRFYQHVHMIWPRMPLFYLAFLLLRQLPEHLSRVPP